MKYLVTAILAAVLFGVGFQVKKAYDETPAYVGNTYIARKVAEDVKRGSGHPDSAVFAGLKYNALCSQERRNFKLQTSCTNSR